MFATLAINAASPHGNARTTPGEGRRQVLNPSP